MSRALDVATYNTKSLFIMKIQNSLKSSKFNSPSFGMVAKKSLFPFTGMFVVKVQTEVGYCRVIGRVDKANILKDFQWIWDLQKNLKEHIQLFEGSSSRALLRTVWDWFAEEEFTQGMSPSMACLIHAEEQMILSAVGASSLWGNAEKDSNVWYPLIPLDNNFFQDRLVEGYPTYLEFDLSQTLPSQILVIPKPFEQSLSSQESIQQRIFEVKSA